MGKLGHDAEFETEEEFLAAYQVRDYPRPSVTTDIVIFTVLDADLKVLLIQRAGHPFRGKWAIPGGFLDVGQAVGEDQGEDLEAGALRELEEETCLDVASHGIHLEQLRTFGTAGRDPRTRVITVAYFALVPPHLAPFVKARDDAKDAKWLSVTHEVDWENLAFDHKKILTCAVERVRGKIDYSPVAFSLLPETFTVTELRAVHEAIKGVTYNSGNFRRRFKRMQTDGIIEEAPGKRHTGTRPAKVFRFVRDPNRPAEMYRISARET